MDNKFSKVVLALTALISFDAHSSKIWAENDHDLLQGRETIKSHYGQWQRIFLSRGTIKNSDQMYRAPGDDVLIARNYVALNKMIPNTSRANINKKSSIANHIYSANFADLEYEIPPKEKEILERKLSKNSFFPNFAISDQKSANENVSSRGRTVVKYKKQNYENTSYNQSVIVETFDYFDPYKRFIAPSGTLMSVGFVGKQINTLYYGDKDHGLAMQNYVTSLANGVEHLDTYLKAFDKALDATRNKSRCDADIRAEVDWRQSKFAEFTHPAMAKLFAKADLSSIHDYNLNLAKYVKDRTLIVRSEKAAKDLKQSLAKLDVRYGSIRVAEEGDGFGAKPFDDTYFAVERTKEELDIYKADLLGYNKALDGFYEYRYGLINDVRFVADVSKRHPVDGIFQDIMRDRKVRDCLVSL